DAIRQWAALGSLGDDYPFEYTWINIHNKQPVSDEKIKKERKTLPKDKFDKKYRRRYDQLVGASRLLTKMWNAYRFLYFNLDKIDISDIDINPDELSSIDTYFYSEFNKILKEIKTSFDGYNWHDAFTILRPFFWNEMCDNYIEAIKYKFYSDDIKESTLALKNALNIFYKILKLFAIIMPFISEEIYDIIYKDFINSKSIHLEQFPKEYEKLKHEKAKEGEVCIKITKNLRQIKSKNKIPLNQEIDKIILIKPEGSNKISKKALENIKQTLRIKELIVSDKLEREIETNDNIFKENIEEMGIETYFFI
ncbi:MAG: class I tRNA ligase family protein, partial [Candidatus Lokiarchaeota archaeon]